MEQPIVDEHVFLPIVAVERCKVVFTRSSTKDGGVGYTLQVSEGCTEEEADRIFDLAYALKLRADAVLAGKTVQPTEDAHLEVLEELILMNIDEDDMRDADHLFYSCRNCRADSSKDDYHHIRHETDCVVGKAAAAIAKALGQETHLEESLR